MGFLNQFITFGGTTLYHCHYSYHQSSLSENFHMAENNPFIDEWPIKWDYFSHVYVVLPDPEDPCMEYLPTLTPKVI